MASAIANFQESQSHIEEWHRTTTTGNAEWDCWASQKLDICQCQACIKRRVGRSRWSILIERKVEERTVCRDAPPNNAALCKELKEIPCGNIRNEQNAKIAYEFLDKFRKELEKKLGVSLEDVLEKDKDKA